MFVGFRRIARNRMHRERGRCGYNQKSAADVGQNDLLISAIGAVPDAECAARRL
jgi:hypothetical protein